MRIVAAMQSSLVLWKAPDSFSFFKKPSSPTLNGAVNRGSQQAQQFGQPLMKKCTGNWDQKWCSAVVLPQGMVPSTLWSSNPDTSEASTQTELLKEDAAVWVWGCQGAWDPSLRLGQWDVDSLPAPRSWALLEGLHCPVKEPQEISSLGSIRGDESEKLAYAFWEIRVAGWLSQGLVQHGEQTGGIRGLCAVAGLQPHWGHRKKWWDSSHDWSAVMNRYGLFGADRPGRQGEEVARYWRKQQEYTELFLGMVSQLRIYQSG